MRAAQQNGRRTMSQIAHGATSLVTAHLAFALALGCGLIAANLYYAQPLTGPIGIALDIPFAATGILVTLTQIGYGLGLLFVVPLGDIIENRRLVVTATCVAGLALVVMAMAPLAAVFMAAALVLGAASTSVQILLPYAAQLTPAANRGRVIGQLTSGLMLGIALARPLASMTTYYFGWRAIFALSALSMAAVAMILSVSMPRRRPQEPSCYGRALRSFPSLLRDLPILRRRAIYHTALYASFSLFWTAMPLLLGSARFALSQRSIGLFALAGTGGVVVAPIAGWVADRGQTKNGTGGAILAMLAAFVIGLAGGEWRSVGLLVVAAVLVDAGLVINFVLSQRAIYEPKPESRSQIGGLFTAIFFTGGAIGSAVGTASLAYGGWPLACGIGIALALFALLAFAQELLSEPKPRNTSPGGG
jgi:predicted MFS family arabinose efflux permease